MNFTIFFDIIYESYGIISTHFYIYLQYFQYHVHRHKLTKIQWWRKFGKSNASKAQNCRIVSFRLV